MHATVPCRFDVMLHVADEKRLARGEFVLFENDMNFLALVPDAHERLVNEAAKGGHLRLNRPMVRVDAAEDKRAQTVLAAELQELPRMRQRHHGILALLKLMMKPVLELPRGDVREEF